MLRRKIHCPLCESELAVPHSAPVGARVECASCEGMFRIPAYEFEVHGTSLSGTDRDTVPDSASLGDHVTLR